MTIRMVASTKGQKVDLFRGWPNPSLLPPLMLRDAANRTLSQTDEAAITEILEYGEDEGYKPLRQAIASWLTQFYKPQSSISYERICITGGASQNLTNVLQTFTDPIYTQHVWMVAPTYYLACRILADGGFDGRMRSVSEDDQGIDLAMLEEGLKTSRQRDTGGNILTTVKQPKPWRKLYRHLIYCVPTFANPSGRIMSLKRRQDLIRLARKYDALVVSDDVYDMLQWSADAAAAPKALDRACLPRLVDIDRDLDGGPINEFGNTVSNGSFSKIVGPGVRTGWAEGTPRLAYGLSQTGSSRSGGAPSQLVASFMYDLIKTETLQNHIYRFLQPEYASRYHRMMSAIRDHLLPLGLTTPQADKDIAGGYFVWLKLPGQLQANVIYEKALEQDLIIIAGSRFRVEGDESNDDARFEQNIRLCIAWADKDLLEEGVMRLGKIIRTFQERG